MAVHIGIDELFIIQNLLFLQDKADQSNRLQSKRDTVLDPFQISVRLGLDAFLGISLYSLNRGIIVPT